MSKISYELIQQILREQKYKEILNYDKVVDLGVKAMWQELCSKVDSPDIDPTDIFSEEMENLQHLEYSMKLMNICCLSETWEQDLYAFLKEKGLIEVNSNDYKNTKRIFEQNYPTCVISNYPKIEEMRALVNAIKHGEGNALNNIRRLTADSILADSNISTIDENGVVVRKKQIEYDSNTLTSKTLKVDGKLQEYSDAVVGFWKDVHRVEREREDVHKEEREDDDVSEK